VTPADDQGEYSSDEGVWYGKVSEKLKNSKVFFCFSIFNRLLIF